MKKTSKPIVFFGSGPVAAESLRLLAKDFTIEAVITKPRPPHHKGAVPVLEVATQLGIPILTAINKQDLDELFTNKPVASKLAVLIDFGIIVSQRIIDYFPLGIINSHFSLLPEWRGADPITFSILSGQNETGVSLMLLSAGMDEGPILAQGTYHLDPSITTPELTDRLINLSHELLANTIPAYIEGSMVPVEQADLPPSSHTLSYSRKLSKEDGILDFTKPAEQLEREIRAFCEWPKSHAKLGNIDTIITKGKVVQSQGKPGTRDVLNRLPVVYCGQDALAIERIKPAGKQEMTGEAFLAGYKAHFLA